ncbi:MAG: hypothetical protein ACRDN0_19300, partial [Trebonia sp.]
MKQSTILADQTAGDPEPGFAAAPSTHDRCGTSAGTRSSGPAQPLFFSPDALYLVAWDARAGEIRDETVEWPNLIRLRAGGTARIIPVATHSDEQEPDEGWPQALREQFPGLLAACWNVDCESGRGMAGLRLDIAREVADARRFVTEVLPENWAQARDEILALAATDPVISHQVFTD